MINLHIFGIILKLKEFSFKIVKKKTQNIPVEMHSFDVTVHILCVKMSYTTQIFVCKFLDTKLLLSGCGLACEEETPLNIVKFSSYAKSNFPVVLNQSLS